MSEAKSFDAFDPLGMFSMLQLRWDLKEVLRVANEAVEKVPDSAWPWHLRGYVLGRLRNWNRAIADIQKSIEMDPNRPQAHADLGAAYFQMTDYRKARSAYEAAIAALRSRGAHAVTCLEAARRLSASRHL